MGEVPTGKTFQLAHRYLALLHGGASADRVLASTFTRKASGEILDRIVARLAAAVVDDNVRREVGHFIGVDELTRVSTLKIWLFPQCGHTDSAVLSCFTTAVLLRLMSTLRVRAPTRARTRNSLKPVSN